MQAKDLHLYIKTAVVAGGAKGIKLFAALANLWLLNAILSKGDFGTLMIGVTLYFFTSAVVTTGFRSLVLYRVAALEEDDPDASNLGGSLLLSGFLTAAAISLIYVLSADVIAQVFGQPDLKFWIYALAAYLPFDLATQVLSYWHRARQKPLLSIIFIDITQPLFRLIALTITFFASLGLGGIVAAYIAEVALSFIILFIIKPLPLKLLHTSLTKSDFFYGLKTSGTQLLQQPTRSLDILLVGAFAGALATAEYALASRLIMVLMLGQQLIDPLITPRLRKFYKQENWNDLRTEYDMTKYFSFIVTLAGIAVFAMFGEHILKIFGEYQNSFPLLMLLCASVVIRNGTGKSGDFLYMAGYAGTALICVALAAAIMLVGALLLIPGYAALGAAWALVISSIVLNGLVNLANWRVAGFVTTTTADILFILAGFILCLAAVYALLPNILIVLAFLILGAAYSWHYKHCLNNFAPLLTRFKRS